MGVMPIGGEGIYRDGPNLSPDIRYFTERCLAKGASKRKAEEWARRQVRKGRRADREG